MEGLLYPSRERSGVTYACPGAFIRILARPGIQNLFVSALKDAAAVPF